MTNQHYSIWLQNALGIGARLSEIFDVFSSAEEIYYANEKELETSGVLSKKQIRRLLNKNADIAYNIMQKCAAERADVVTLDSADYPERLRALPDFPAVLYVKGDITCLKRKLPFAIVGTRKVSEPGSLPATQALSASLAQSGFVIVSGGALGIDSAAHTSAITSGGETVAILGCGFGAKYLPSNRVLRDAISENGALITEYPPCIEPTKYTFPIRNRIIAGLSVGVAVMEAGRDSGSLSTAKAAYESGCDVFGLDGAVPTQANMGLYELLRDGAKPINSAMDVFAEYISVYPSKLIVNENINLFQNLRNSCELTCNDFVSLKTERKRIKRKLAANLSEDAHKVYAVFGKDPLGINHIAEAAFLPTGSVLGALSELEIFGYIELLPDTKYILKQEG